MGQISRLKLLFYTIGIRSTKYYVLCTKYKVTTKSDQNIEGWSRRSNQLKVAPRIMVSGPFSDDKAGITRITEENYQLPYPIALMPASIHGHRAGGGVQGGLPSIINGVDKFPPPEIWYPPPGPARPPLENFRRPRMWPHLQCATRRIIMVPYVHM
jgi:hypothetical protein